MSNALKTTWADKSLRTSALAIFFFGTTGAATSPYQTLIGIQELGLSDSVYAALMFAAAIINVSASVMMGILADRMGDYRTSILYVSLFGVFGLGIVYAFANVRANSARLSSSQLIGVNSTIRATISLSWVLMPGVVGVMLAGASSMLPAYLIATLAAILGAFFLPSAPKIEIKGGEARSRFLASLGEVLDPRIAMRVMAIALICSMLHINDAVRPLIVTGKAGGSGDHQPSHHPFAGFDCG